MTARKKAQKSRVSLLMLQSREIGAADFKARCLEIMDEVERLGIEVVITKHRKPVARLVPMAARSTGFCGSLAGMIEWAGDVESPIGAPWNNDESNLA